MSQHFPRSKCFVKKKSNTCYINVLYNKSGAVFHGENGLKVDQSSSQIVQDYHTYSLPSKDAFILQGTMTTWSYKKNTDLFALRK